MRNFIPLALLNLLVQVRVDTEELSIACQKRRTRRAVDVLVVRFCHLGDQVRGLLQNDLPHAVATRLQDLGGRRLRRVGQVYQQPHDLHAEDVDDDAGHLREQWRAGEGCAVHNDQEAREQDGDMHQHVHDRPPDADAKLLPRQRSFGEAHQHVGRPTELDDEHGQAEGNNDRGDRAEQEDEAQCQHELHHVVDLLLKPRLCELALQLCEGTFRQLLALLLQALLQVVVFPHYFKPHDDGGHDDLRDAGDGENQQRHPELFLQRCHTTSIRTSCLGMALLDSQEEERRISIDALEHELLAHVAVVVGGLILVILPLCQYRHQEVVHQLEEENH
mmetsp:Transcript_917/g.2111  ORF Transcript_917/g.2111 Transcript_917/m.2111 type:complete len:333 (+) Transcript_917:175-1173(+)